MRRAFAAAVLAGVVATGGCGGSSGSKPPPTTGVVITDPATLAYIHKVDVICASITRQVNKLGAGTNTTAVAVFGAIRKLLPVIGGGVDDLENASGPAAAKAALENHLIIYTRQDDTLLSKYLGQFTAAAGNAEGQQAALAALNNDTTLNADHTADDAALAAAGFKDCAQTNGSDTAASG